jgi:glycosyltransferase involved in cell wall biosynthesis
MRVLLTSEAKFERTPDGVIWGAAPYGCANWLRYLDVFTGAVLIARVADVQRPSSGCVPASGPGIEFRPLPPYSGLSGLVRHFGRVHGVVRAAVADCEAVVVRSPSPVASLASRAVLAAGRRYGAQIVGDPDQVFSAGAFRHPLRAPLRTLATAAQKRLSQNASAVLFVTRRVLQAKYPTKGLVYSASDVSLDDSDFEGPRHSQLAPSGVEGPAAPFTLLTVGSLDQPYKGTSVLLDAAARLHRRGAGFRLRIVGAGRLLPALQQQADEVGLGRAVEFAGQMDRDGVRRSLDAADLFVLPSLTEGLPRALLEAMARGVAAVASDVGGIPELLAPEYLVPPGQPQPLADAIHGLMTSDRMRAAAAERNRQVARQYHQREQVAIRNAFLRSVAGDVSPRLEPARA